MAFNKKEEEVIRWGLQNGKSPQEIKDAVMNLRVGTTLAPDTKKPKPTLSERLSRVGSQSGETISQAIAGEGEFEGASPIRRGVEATAESFSVPVKGAFEMLPESARGLLGKVGENIKSGFEKITSKLASTSLLKEIGELEAQGAISPETTPEFYDLKESLGTAVAGGEIAGEILGAEGLATGVSKTAGRLGNVAQQSKNLLGGITKKGTSGIAEATSKALDPNLIMQRVARISKGKQAKFQQIAGESVGEYLVKRGIFGNIDDITTQLYKRFKKSKSSADDALSKLGGEYKPKPVQTALDELLTNEVAVSSPGAVSKDFTRVRSLYNKYSKEGLTMSEINEVKRIYERNIKLDFLKENNPKGVQRANNIDNAMREWQFAKAEELGLKNLPDINKETRLSRQLLDDLGKEYAGSAGNNAITLTDWVILAGGDPTAVGGFLAKKGFSSKGVQSAIAKKLSPEPTVGEPTAVFGEPTVDGYLNFIKKVEGESFNGAKSQIKGD